MRDKCTNHVQKYELHDDNEQVDTDKWHYTVVFFDFFNAWPLFQQETPQSLEGPTTSAELYEIAPKLNLEHDNKACETEHEDNGEVDELIFGKFYDVKKHSDLAYIFLDEVQELKYNKGCREALAISVAHEFSANLV